MTQASLAEAVGLTEAHIEAIESGSVAAALEVMVKIAAVLNVRNEELLAGR
jgi:DNA-binding XRE family transcriptional regulator